MSFTKLYLLDRAAPYTPATIRGTYNDTAGAVTRALEPLKDVGGAFTTVARAEANATNPYRVLLYRGVSGPLDAQTISGTVDVVLGLRESNAAADFNIHLHIYVTQGDSDTPRGTLLTNYEEAAGTNEWPTTATGTGLASAQTLANIGAITKGDRLVVEIGYTARNAVTTSYTGTLNYGTQLANGDPAADLTVGSTSVTTQAGHLVFSNAITEASDLIGDRVTQSGITTLQYDSAVPDRLTQAGATVLYHERIPSRLTQSGIILLWIPPTTMTGSVVFGVKTTVRAARGVASGLDNNTNTLSQAGKKKIFGNFEVTGNATIPGTMSQRLDALGT